MAKGIKPFSYLSELSMTFILLKNVQMPTFVGILMFNSKINTLSECLKHFSFYNQLKFRTHV